MNLKMVNINKNKKSTKICGGKKVREPTNVRRELSRVIQEMVIKELIHVMLEPYIVGMEPSNLKKKKVKEPPNVRKTVTCDIKTT